MVRGILRQVSKALGVENVEGQDYSFEDKDLEGGDIFHEKVDRWIMPINFKTLEDLNIIKHELSQGNLVLLDMKPIAKMERRTKTALLDLKKYCIGTKGDMARLTEHKFMLTPSKVKIVKRKR